MTVQEIYDIALAIMNEDECDTYTARTPAIVNTLIGRCWQYSQEHEYGGHSFWNPIAAMEDEVDGIDKTILTSAMPYGLAALLFLDEDPARSNSWWGIFEAQLAECRRNRPAEAEDIENRYGVIEYPRFGRW